VPPPTTTDNNKFVDTQLKKSLVPDNRKNGDDLLNLSQKKPKIDSKAPNGVVPPPATTDKNNTTGLETYPSRLKKPLIPENRKDIGSSNDDLYHVRAQKDGKINPQHPTDLVPAPTTQDNDKLVDKQLKKPLIKDNMKDKDALAISAVQKKSKIDP
jgi:hypothetical protein